MLAGKFDFKMDVWLERATENVDLVFAQCVDITVLEVNLVAPESK